MYFRRQLPKAQTAVEYLLLFGVVTAFVMVGFKIFLPKVNQSSERYYNKAAIGILGPPPLPANVDAARINYP